MIYNTQKLYMRYYKNVKFNIKFHKISINAAKHKFVAYIGKIKVSCLAVEHYNSY